ncbi:CoA-transferase, partial [Xanthomonas oryzae]|uniref:CoA-transferase n=3 Tax=Xanthomonas oryzae TaxID=347 RepID=UPI0027E4C49C
QPRTLNPTATQDGGTSQIDRYANLNTTVIGPYDAPKTRLPGAGGAPEIAASAKQVFIIIRQSTRSFVPTLDFITTVGHLYGGDARVRAGFPGAGPTVVVTDLCVMEPDPVTRELTLTSLHPGTTREQVSAATGWPIRFAADLAQTTPPGATELDVLRALQARTDAAHDAQAAGAEA